MTCLQNITCHVLEAVHTRRFFLSNLTALDFGNRVAMKRLGLQHGTAFLMALLTFEYVGAEQLVERQNPAFITALPTVAATTLSTSSTTPSSFLPPSPSPDSPNSPQQPGPIFTPSPSTAAAPSSSALLPPAVLPSSVEISSTTSPATPFRPTTTRATQAAASAVEIIEDHYFGGIPKPNPDAPITGIFMVLFLVGALVYGWMYWKNAKRPTKGSNGDRLSALMICFCLAEALVCIFRIAWASTDMQAVVIFLALVSESIG